MVAQVQTHETSLSLTQAESSEHFAGTNMALQVQVSCASTCDLRGLVVRIIAQDETVLKEVELTGFDGATYQTEEFLIELPDEPGEYMWTAQFPEQEQDGDLFQESVRPFSFVIKPHTTSMAVWDVASPVVVDAGFRLKVGVKCSAGCNLAGEVIEIYDHEGANVAIGILGDVPYADTVDLYWTEVDVPSPATKGAYRWEAMLAKPSLEPSHKAAAYKFGFATVGQPEHVVTIEVVDQDTKAPVANARVMLRPYSGLTDDTGTATLEAAGGEYQLDVMQEKYDTFKTVVTVVADATIQVELIPSLYREDYRGNLVKVERRKSLRR